MKLLYENTVENKGVSVDAFKDQNMFILFGSSAPDTLKDYCYTIEVNPIIGEITEGQTVEIDGKQYKITAVGNLVNRNLANLGHVTFSFSGAENEELPGTISVEKITMPDLTIGSTIKIFSK